MKYIKTLAVAAMALTVSMSSCDMGDFGDINVNPNKPGEAYTDMLYTYSAQWVRNFTMNSSSYVLYCGTAALPKHFCVPSFPLQAHPLFQKPLH